MRLIGYVIIGLVNLGFVTLALQTTSKVFYFANKKIEL